MHEAKRAPLRGAFLFLRQRFSYSGTMKTRIAIGAAVLLPAMSLADPNHDFVEMTYGAGDLDFAIVGLGSADIDQDGVKLEGSFIPRENLLVRGSYSALSGEESGVDVDSDTLIIGAGWVYSVGDSTAIDIGLQYRNDDLRLADALGSEPDDVNGAGLALGFTSTVSDATELSARFAWLGRDYDGAISIDLSAVYYVNDTLGIVLGWESVDGDEPGFLYELNQFQLGVRAKL